MDRKHNKRYKVFELHSNLDLMRPVWRFEGSRPKTKYFDTRDDAETWIAKNAMDGVEYVVVEVFTQVSSYNIER